MKPDYLLCDVCGSKVPNGMTIFFAEGSEMDPSGNDCVDTGVHADLCLGCLRKLVQRSFKLPLPCLGYDYELGKRFAELFKSMRSKAMEK